jgi:hypothetical protein
VCACSGARSDLHECVLKGSQTLRGLVVHDAGSRLVAAGCTASGNAESGVVVCEDAIAELPKCVLSSNTLIELEVDKGSKARALACRLQDNRQGELWLTSAGEGEGAGFTSTGNGSAGYAAKKRGSLRSTDCTSSDSSHSVLDVCSDGNAELPQHGLLAKLQDAINHAMT